MSDIKHAKEIAEVFAEDTGIELTAMEIWKLGIGLDSESPPQEVYFRFAYDYFGIDFREVGRYTQGLVKGSGFGLRNHGLGLKGKASFKEYCARHANQWREEREDFLD